jgi:hypothetical protein
MSDPILMAEADVLPADKTMGRQVLEKLHKHYPGWSWVVDVPRGQNVVVVRNLDCDPRGTMGFVLHKRGLFGDASLKNVMFAGGEFLERYRMRTAGYRDEEVADRTMIFEKPQQ